MKKFLVITFCLITACSGYQPIYKVKNSNNYIFEEIKLLGDKRINKRIKSSLNLKEDKNNQSLNEIKITTNKEINETSKDSKGQVSSYRTTIRLDLLVVNDDEVLKKKSFVKDFSYNKKDNKFELSEYQREIEISLVDEIIKELTMYLNL